MATQSIFNSIVINDSNAAEFFVNALEKASQLAETSIPCNIEYEDLSKDSLEKYFGAIKK